MPTTSIVANAAPDKVFGYLADLPRHEEWAADPARPEPVNGDAVAVGKQYVSHNGHRGKPVEDQLEVTVYDPPARFGFTAAGPELSMEHVFNLRPQEGGTLVERVSTVARMPLPFMLIFPLIYRMMAKPSAIKSMAQLKAKCEALP